MVNDFRPFGAAMAKLSTGSKTIAREDGADVQLSLAIDKKHRRIDTAYEIYLALYQAITGPEDRQKLFRELSPDYFDLIVVDECHRGSAAADSAWREILDYFSSATQIGLTATPYHAHVPSFGEWGYVLASRRPWRLPESLPTGLRFLSVPSLPLLFDFPLDMARVPAEVNRLSNQVLVNTYEREWGLVAAH
ncbi:MAG: DEAD/DEAH box helicase family protein, partial [Giesbergeria sp.]